MVQRCGHTQQAAEFNSARRPSAKIVGKQLKQRQGPLTTAIAEGVGNFATRNKSAVAAASFHGGDIAGLTSFRCQTVANQIGNVGDHPILTGLNKPIVV